MGQSDIINFLEKNMGKKFTTKQIANELKISINSVQRSCNKAWENNLIERGRVGNSIAFVYFKMKKNII